MPASVFAHEKRAVTRGRSRRQWAAPDCGRSFINCRIGRKESQGIGTGFGRDLGSLGEEGRKSLLDGFFASNPRAVYRLVLAKIGEVRSECLGVSGDECFHE